MNIDPAAAAAAMSMNPPAAEATGSSGSGPGDANSGPDYAALLQYLQYYQKQMGNDEMRR